MNQQEKQPLRIFPIFLSIIYVVIFLGFSFQWSGFARFLSWLPGEGPPVLSSDILDLQVLAERLRDTNSPLSKFIVSSFSDDARELLINNTTTNIDDTVLKKSLAVELTRIILQNRNGSSFFESARFQGVIFSNESRELRQKELAKSLGVHGVTRLNRLLLEDAFPSAIARSTDHIYARKWFIASQIINAIGCLVAAYYVAEAKAARFISFFLGGLFVAQIGIIWAPSIYVEHWPITICIIQYILFIFSDILGIWKTEDKEKATREFELPLFLTDLPALSVTLIVLICSVWNGASFSFATGMAAAITILNNFTYAALQSKLKFKLV